MFEKTLQDLVKGIRNHKRDRAQYISQAIAEIKRELSTTDMRLKTLAVQKITYLQMLGYDVSWAAFHVVEVMAAPKFATKRVGMLAAQQVFTSSTEVTLLCSNLLKKELASRSPYQTGAALNCLANIATPDLARDLVEDVAAMLSSTNPFLRKKAILALYKLYLTHPMALKQVRPR
jgi:AP-3 complex subunit delta-1